MNPYGVILNDQQEKIKNEAVHWFLYESEQVFEIAGPAGTGKSVLIGQILRELNLSANQIAPMSFTGQASIVMRTRGFPNARSIHSTLYEVVDVEDNSIDLAAKFGAKGKKKEFRLRTFIDPAIRLFFIDEAWMVPDYMVKDILSFGIKVIVAGDQHQLPPVGGNPGFLTRPGVHYLTQLMRQAEDDPIVYLANRAMNGEPIHSGKYGDNVLVINDDEVIPEMFGFVECILCGTNRTREIMNGYIRYLAGYSDNIIPRYGERVICRKNNWELSIDGISLANGLSGTVVNNPDPMSFDGQIFKINFKPDLIDRVFWDLPVNYKYFTAPFDEKNGLKSSFDAKWLLGELFDYAYALTTHLSQGSEYNSCMYIEEYMRYDIQKQLNYTGITRAKQFLIYVKKNKRNIVFVDSNFPIQ